MMTNASIVLYVRSRSAFEGLVERLEHGEGASDLAKRILIAVLMLSAIGAIIYAAVQSAANQAASSITSPGF
jgi:hypothetical protein